MYKTSASNGVVVGSPSLVLVIDGKTLVSWYAKYFDLIYEDYVEG